MKDNSQPSFADGAGIRQQIVARLHSAAAHLRSLGDYDILNNEPQILTTFDLAAFIEQSAGKIAAGDDTPGRRLWGIFAPTCTWDDAGGDSELGEEVFELLNELYRQH